MLIERLAPVLEDSLRSLTDFAIRQEYERIKDLGDKLVEIGNRIKWEGFRPKLEVPQLDRMVRWA